MQESFITSQDKMENVPPLVCIRRDASSAAGEFFPDLSSVPLPSEHNALISLPSGEPPQEYTKVYRYIEGLMKEEAARERVSELLAVQRCQRAYKPSGVTDQVIPGKRGQGRMKRGGGGGAVTSR